MKLRSIVVESFFWFFLKISDLTLVELEYLGGLVWIRSILDKLDMDRVDSWGMGNIT